LYLLLSFMTYVGIRFGTEHGTAVKNPPVIPPPRALLYNFLVSRVTPHQMTTTMVQIGGPSLYTP